MTMNPADLPDSWPPDEEESKGKPEKNPWEGPRPEILAPPIADMELAKSLAMEIPRAYLWGRCVKAVDEHCVLIDLPVLWTRSVAQVVVELLGEPPIQWYHGVPIPIEHCADPEDWVDARVSEAIGDLINEDAEAYMEGEAQPDPLEPRHVGLTESYGVDPDTVLAASVRFNRLAFEPRQAFFAVFVQQMDLTQCPEKGMGTPEEVKALAQEAYQALLTPDEPYTGINLEDIL